MLLAVRRWSKQFANKLILLEIDNMMCNLYCLRKGMCKNNLAMDFIREIFTLKAVHNFAFCVGYIKSKDNIMVVIIIAAELLLDWDKLILLPDYNMCDNMSESAICQMDLLRQFKFSNSVLVENLISFEHDIDPQMQHL